jgi:hypothetical protein
MTRKESLNPAAGVVSNAQAPASVDGLLGASFHTGVVGHGDWQDAGGTDWQRFWIDIGGEG